MIRAFAFLNSATSCNSLLYSLYPNWDITDDVNTPIKMAYTWVYYWPTQNYTSEKELGTFLSQNESTRAKLFDSASKVIQLCKTYNLI